MKPGISFRAALEAAVKIEENGAAFYEEAARQSADPSAMEAFRKLAVLEREHRDFFLGLAAAEGSKPRDGSLPAELTLLADRSVFDLGAGAAGLLNSRETGPQAVKIAIGLEKESIVFYAGLKNAMRSRTAAAKLDGIIAEELRHISVLRGLMRSAI